MIAGSAVVARLRCLMAIDQEQHGSVTVRIVDDDHRLDKYADHTAVAPAVAVAVDEGPAPLPSEEQSAM